MLFYAFSPLEITTYLFALQNKLIRYENSCAAESGRMNEDGLCAPSPAKRYKYISFEMRLCKRSSRSRNESLGVCPCMKDNLVHCNVRVAKNYLSRRSFFVHAAQAASNSQTFLPHKRSSMIPWRNMTPLSTRAMSDLRIVLTVLLP